MQDNRTPSTAAQILRPVGYVLVFALFITTTALSLPAHVARIVVGGILLFFAVSGFIMGWQWDEPRTTYAARRLAERVLAIALLLMLINAAFDVFHESGHTWQYFAFLASIVVIVLMVVTLLPFFLGRAIHRRTRVPG